MLRIASAQNRETNNDKEMRRAKDYCAEGKAKGEESQDS